MHHQPRYSLGGIKTTALGGLLFLLPIVVIGYVLAYVYAIAAGSYHHVKPWIPFDSATGIVLVFCLAIMALLVACFVLGLIAQRAIGRHFTQSIEQQLIRVYPKYAIYKDLLAGKFGGDGSIPSLRPVLVRNGGLIQVAFEADRSATGLAVIYLPGAPDAWNGSIAVVATEQIQPIDVPFSQVLAMCERLGRHSESLLRAATVAEAVACGQIMGSAQVTVSKASG